MKRIVLLLALVVFLLPCGLAAAQAPNTAVVQRTIAMGGAAVNSESYSVVTVIGQPSAAIVASSTYKVSGGFLYARPQASKSDHNLWLPVIRK